MKLIQSILSFNNKFNLYLGVKKLQLPTFIYYRQKNYIEIQNQFLRLSKYFLYELLDTIALI